MFSSYGLVHTKLRNTLGNEKAHNLNFNIFWKNIEIKDLKSDSSVLYNTILQFLKDQGLDLSKLCACGSDGEAVMVGKTNGVAAKHIPIFNQHIGLT